MTQKHKQMIKCLLKSSPTLESEYFLTVIVTLTHLKTKLFLIGLGVGKGERMIITKWLRN